MNQPTKLFRKRVADKVVELCNVLMQEHVDPPAKQQLILAAVKTAWSPQETNEANAAGGELGEPKIRRLGRDVSELASDADITNYLVQCFDEIGVTEETHSNLADRMVESLLFAAPGGGQVTKASGVKVAKQLAENQYVGIGIALSQANGMPVVSKCFYDGPGFRVGVRTNDVILKIEGTETSGRTLADVVELLRGEKGSDVKLVLRNPSDSLEREITVTRDVTFIPTVAGIRADQNGRWIHRLQSDPKFAHLHIERFGPSTVHELKKLAGELASSEKPVEGVILDLRRGGGPLKDVVMVADQFLESGAIGAAVFPNRVQAYEAGPGTLFDGVPMVILIAPTSSASSVLLATALRDNDRAAIIGSPTSGVSYIRGAFSLTNGDQVVFPTGYIRRANGNVMAPRLGSGTPIPMQSAGRTIDAAAALPAYVVPDHFVKNDPTATHQPAQQSYHPENSPIMSTAIAVLRARVSDQKNVAGRGTDKPGGDS